MNDFRSVLVESPSNIAVIKYMGKIDSTLNLPENPSLSLTLDRLASVTEVGWRGPGRFVLDWQGVQALGSDAELRPMDLPAIEPAQLSKMERHLLRVAQALRPDLDPAALGQWRVKTGNRFPAGAGIASSASGFAALTFGVAALLKTQDQSDWDRAQLARLSRQGSGSSCRSFFGPWVAWEGDSARPLRSPSLELADLVILVDEKTKPVGSSEAHQRIKTSPLWSGRKQRAQDRFQEISHIIESDDLERCWSRFAEVCFEEALDMHELFHTAQPGFGYMSARTREVLEWLARQKSLPIAITLDAGPNVHLLLPKASVGEVRGALRQKWKDLQILQDQQGTGVRAVRA